MEVIEKREAWNKGKLVGHKYHLSRRTSVGEIRANGNLKALLEATPVRRAATFWHHIDCVLPARGCRSRHGLNGRGFVGAS